MSWGVVFGLWPFLASGLALTGGMSLGVEGSRGPLVAQIRVFRWQGVEGSPLRLDRVDVVSAYRWGGGVEGGAGVMGLRLSMLGGRVWGWYPVLYGGWGTRGALFGRIGVRMGITRPLLWTVGIEGGVRLR